MAKRNYILHADTKFSEKYPTNKRKQNLFVLFREEKREKNTKLLGHLFICPNNWILAESFETKRVLVMIFFFNVENLK